MIVIVYVLLINLMKFTVETVEETSSSFVAIQPDPKGIPEQNFDPTFNAVQLEVYGQVRPEEDYDSFIITCHTTDFECFRRQYLSLRNNILLGNNQLGITKHYPYMFQYSDTMTCVRITGVEETQLRRISMDSTSMSFSMELTMPVHIQQLRNKTMTCAKPNREFAPVGPYLGPLKKFSGNATIEINYQYMLNKKAGDEYLVLDDQNLDVVLDIPDLSQYDKNSELEQKLYEWSEWAYKMVQHVDVAEHVIAPYFEQVKALFNTLPLKRFILLYPEEKLTDIHFKLSGRSSSPINTSHLVISDAVVDDFSKLNVEGKKVPTLASLNIVPEHSRLATFIQWDKTL